MESGSRQHRVQIGFNRLGILLASTALLIGAVFFVPSAYVWLKPLVKPPGWLI